MLCRSGGGSVAAGHPEPQAACVENLHGAKVCKCSDRYGWDAGSTTAMLTTRVRLKAFDAVSLCPAKCNYELARCNLRLPPCTYLLILPSTHRLGIVHVCKLAVNRRSDCRLQQHLSVAVARRKRRLGWIQNLPTGGLEDGAGRRSAIDVPCGSAKLACSTEATTTRAAATRSHQRRPLAAGDEQHRVAHVLDYKYCCSVGRCLRSATHSNEIRQVCPALASGIERLPAACVGNRR